jgi:cysteinyl-tRNA synthetase
MSMKYLGETFDIHCGGVDNIFPHHENEIAQSESATGKPFARMWLHSEHLLVDGEKMSKSLGNFHTLRDLVERGEDPRAMRYLLLSVHYRQKLNFTAEALKAAAGALRRLDEMRFRLLQAPAEGPSRQWVGEAAARLEEEFAAALADDLNLSAALGALFGFVKKVNLGVETADLGEGDPRRLLGALQAVDGVLGVLDPEAWKSPAAEDAGVGDEEIQRLVDERSAARERRDFECADRIREELARLGVTVEDTPLGSRWKRS